MLPSGPPGFRNAPVSKYATAAVAVASFVASIYGLGPYVDLRIVPQVTREAQAWRFITSTLVFQTSFELLFGLLLTYQFRQLERFAGPRRFASQITLAWALTTGAQTALLLFSPQKTLAPGPYGVLFALLVRYARTVPATWRVGLGGGAAVTNKAVLAFLAVQLAVSRGAASAVPAAFGLAAGVAVEQIGVLRQFRLPRLPRALQRPNPPASRAARDDAAWPADAPSPFSASAGRDDGGFSEADARPLAESSGLRRRDVPAAALTDTQAEALCGLGFTRAQVEAAWPRAHGDVERCAALLLDGAAD